MLRRLSNRSKVCIESRQKSDSSKILQNDAALGTLTVNLMFQFHIAQEE